MKKRYLIILVLFTCILPTVAVVAAILAVKEEVKIEVKERLELRELEQNTPEVKDTVYIERGTTYNAVPSQCDNDPFTTADGSVIDPNLLAAQKIRWVAVSRDLIKDSYRNKHFPSEGHWNGVFGFGDTIMVSSVSSPQINGVWIIHDTMNKRYKKSIDFLFAPQNNKPKLGVCRDIKIVKYVKLI